MTSGDLRFDLSEKIPDVTSAGTFGFFRMPFTASFYLLVSELDEGGGAFDPPPPWRCWLRPPPGRGLRYREVVNVIL